MKNNNKSKAIIGVICILSFIASLVAVGNRLTVEKAKKSYDIAVKYTEVLNISRKNAMAYEDVLKELKQSGVNLLLVDENTVISDSADNLASLQAQGKATYFTGYALLDKAGGVSENSEIKPSYNYIWCLDQSTQDNIYEYYSKKGYLINKVDFEGRSYLEIPYSTSTLAKVGVGFNVEDLKKAADLGFAISPQISSMKTKSDEATEFVIEQVKNLPALGPVFFKDADLACYENDKVYELLSQQGMGFVEFFSNKQRGFNHIAENSSKLSGEYKVYRLHTLTDGEVDKYEGESLYDRFDLALTERGISYFLFKSPKKYSDQENYQKLKSSIEGFRKIADKDGYTQGNVTALNLGKQNYCITLAAAVATLGIFVLICMEFNITILSCIAALLGFVMYALLLKKKPLLAVQLMGLATSVCFPVYAMMTAMKFKAGSIIESIKGLGSMFLISFGGAAVLVATMARTEFAVGIELFRGVKIAFMLPILILVLYLVYAGGFLKPKKIEEIAKMPITYFVVAIAAVLGVIFLIYIVRSGNSGTATDTEVKFRQILRDVMGTRPRTKEFLISYPIIICMIYFGKHKLYIPLAALATVGPVSVINTFSHVHTPVIVSIKRGLCGLILGIILGVILVYVVKVAIKVLKKYFHIQLAPEKEYLSDG